MTTIVSVIFVLMTIIGLVGLCFGEISGILCCILAVISIGSCLEEPTALDVYQGKTELEYTVVRGVHTDSAVVFKKDFAVKEEPDYEDW